MNKQLIAHRFSKATDTYTREAVVQQKIAGKMIQLLHRHLPNRHPKRVIEFGCGTGIYSRLILQTLQPEQLLLNDICSEMKHCCSDLLGHGVSFVEGDAEVLPFPKETELITSCSTLQWFDTPDVFFRRCNESLSASGYFAFTTFGQENMREIKELTSNGLSYRSLNELKTSLSPLYDIVHAEEEIVPMHFDTPMQVLYHLKQTGVTGTGGHTWTRQSLNEFCQQYVSRFTHNEAVTLTYHPIYIIAKKK
ncbi:MAG: malonyl-ACP O-methyltransferase BioC [Bacteroides sp.]|uniref:malonyl-ACP O-methyltransferase BioC n=1 Tax=Bacteroides sp. TaxID=29523 RepID=UPI002FC6F758